MAKPEAYDDLCGFLEEVPILKWACHRVGLASSSVYEMMKNNPEMKTRILRAKAIGQGKLVPLASPDRVLSWSDPETFSLRQEHQIEGGVTVNITNPAGLGMSPDTEDENDGERNGEG